MMISTKQKRSPLEVIFIPVESSVTSPCLPVFQPQIRHTQVADSHLKSFLSRPGVNAPGDKPPWRRSEETSGKWPSFSSFRWAVLRGTLFASQTPWPNQTMLPAAVTPMYFLVSAFSLSLDHLPNERHVPESLSQALLLGKYKIRQWQWKDYSSLNLSLFFPFPDLTHLYCFGVNTEIYS